MDFSLQGFGMVVNNSIYDVDSPCVDEVKTEEDEEGFVEKKGEIGEGKDGDGEIDSCLKTGEGEEEKFGGSRSSSSDFLASSEATVNEEHSTGSSSEDSSSSPSPSSTDVPKEKNENMVGAQNSDSSDVSEDLGKPCLGERKLEKQGSTALSEIELMKERFSKLLLGEDMSGCGNGVSTALAISNAITNLCATVFGQIWRLEPLPSEKRLMWRREMEWLLCVSDYIVELIPTWQTYPDGSKLEVMTCRPRSDLYVNLPALRKLDNMLLEILDSFEKMEFWYVDQGVQALETDGSSSLRKLLPRQEEKWWLPVPRVPAGGLGDDARKLLQHKRDCTNQILKAAMAINSITLADMDVPESFLEALPKNAKGSLGDFIHRYVSSDQFTPECLLDCLDLSSEHQALEIANRVEASIFIWRRKNSSKPVNGPSRSFSRSSWDLVKELVADADKRELLADRAESLLLCLRQRFPGLPQTTLDMSKIQYNKDVGRSILESYSRVLESLSFNIVSRIDDLIYVDDLTKHSDKLLSIAKSNVVTKNIVGNSYTLPTISTPYKTAFTTPTISPSTGGRSPIIENMIPHRGLGVKKILTDYLSIDPKEKQYGNQLARSNSFSGTREASHKRRLSSLESLKQVNGSYHRDQSAKNETSTT